jgi:hypothetical protein
MCEEAAVDGTTHPCPAGRYSTAGSSVCNPCPAGTYGSTTGLTSPTCSGNCSEGHACPAASTNATTTLCPSGQYSLAGAGTCTPCPLGRYGATAGVTDPNCTAQCPAGTAGSSPGLTTPACSGSCTAGYACPAGSTSPAPPASLCPMGKYSLAGAQVCSLCPAGRYGDVQGAQSSDCTGPCQAGFACGVGTTTPTPSAGLCPPGKFSLAGAQVCSLCPGGSFGAGYGLQREECSGPCQARGWWLRYAHPYRLLEFRPGKDNSR